MSINLEHLLKRNKTSLKKFILNNNIKSYNELVEYCKSRNFSIIEKEKYDIVLEQIAPKKKEKEIKHEQKNIKKQVAKRKPRRSTRKTSKSQIQK